MSSTTHKMSIEEILSTLTNEEKIRVLSGKFDQHQFMAMSSELVDGKPEFHYNLIPYPTGEEPVTGITPVRFVDGPRGAVCGHSTCFPVSMARGASFDPDLEERIGEAIAKEIRAQGGNYFGGVCINILRHPAVGRAQETYGEDMHLLGQMGAALTRGVQRHNVMACVKHFACNNIENSRFKVDVSIDDKTLHEIYLPHFKHCIDQGAASVMGAYNKVNGDHCCESRNLLTDILRDRWGFKGFVISDFLFGVYDAAKALSAGLDIEMPIMMHYAANLEADLQEGLVTQQQLDDAVRRVLETAFSFIEADDPIPYTPELVCCDDHIALAREAAIKSIVLLKNDKHILPLSSQGGSLGLIGELARIENIGDHGSSRVFPPYITTIEEGLKRKTTAAGIDIYTCFDDHDLEQVKMVASTSDTSILVVGCKHDDEGEFIPENVIGDGSGGTFSATGGDRKSLRLRPEEIAMIKAARESSDRIVLVVIGGSAIILEEILADVDAIIYGWYPGMEGGIAIGDILFGEHSPGGKLPFTLPRDESQLCFFSSELEDITYEYHHGYFRIDKEGTSPRYPFGYGLSYTSFALSSLHTIVDHEKSQVHVAVTVNNTGSVSGDEVIQLYLGYPRQEQYQMKKALKAFKRVSLAPNEEKEVVLSLPFHEFSYYTTVSGGFVVDTTSTFSVIVGRHSMDPESMTSEFSLSR
jgi:beta-glucosidase